MADKTTNYNLIKPTPDEFYDIEIFNENADIIDEKLKEIEDEIENIDAPVTSVNEKTGDVVLTAEDVGALPKTGGTMTGTLTISGGNAINFGGKFAMAYNSNTNALEITVVG